MKSIQECEAEHAACVATLAGSRAYAQLSVAKNYVENKLSGLWRPVLNIDDEDDSLVDQLSFTPTMTLVVHLFGRAVHRFGCEKSKRPVITAWRPVRDKELSGGLRFPHAVSKNDIAKIIGKSRSSVDDAIDRLRGKTSKYEALHENRVARPLYVETGIMLDLMTHRNLSFSFMLEDYEYAKRVAEDARIRDADTNYKQREWCAHATERIAVVGRPEPEIVRRDEAAAEH